MEEIIISRYRCTVCNWVYDEEKEGKKFNDLPKSYFCPICGSPKSAFVPEGIIKEDETVKTTVSDKIIEQLEAFGVKNIYGIPGDSNLPLIDAIRRSKKIKFILTRHEETAAFMASAHGKMTDKIGVCISIAGPGSTNLITGLVDSSTDRSPVLAFTGQVPEIYLGSEAFQEIDQKDIFKPFSEYCETLSRANQALKLLTRALTTPEKWLSNWEFSADTNILGEWKSDDNRPGEYITATDLYIVAKSFDGKKYGFLIEVKFTEGDFSKCGGYYSNANKGELRNACESGKTFLSDFNTCYLQGVKGKSKLHRKYFDFFEKKEFNSQYFENECPFKNNNQCLRNQSLLRAMIKKKRIDKGYFILAHHDDNKVIIEEWDKYVNILSMDAKNELFRIPIGEFVKKSKNHNYKKYFVDRYRIN